MSSRVDERFGNVPQIVAHGVTQYTEGEAATESIANLKVNIDPNPPAGLGFRIRIAGTKATGTNGTLTAYIYLAGTAILTLQADTNATGHWVVDAEILITTNKTQKAWGILHQTTQDPKVDYAAGAVDLSAGGAITAAFALGSGSDEATCEMWTVERWQCELSA